MSQRVKLNSILADPAAVREVGHGLFTALPEDAVAAPYDRRATVYDAIVGRSIYHRIFWGTSAPAYTRFARNAIDAAGDGCFAEAGCGSLVFTAPMYRDVHGTFALLVDRSIQMLRRAVKRLRSANGKLQDDVTILHSDVSALPVRGGVFASVLSLNVLHVPCDADAIIAESSRILMPGQGRLFVSSLVRTGRWSDGYMAALHRVGELGSPLTIDDLQLRVAGRWAVVESMKVEGNMCFMVVRHAG